MTAFLEPSRFGVMSADEVARTVFKAATVARPRTRYSVGFCAKLSPFGRRLTADRVVDFAMTRQVPIRQTPERGS